MEVDYTNINFLLDILQKYVNRENKGDSKDSKGCIEYVGKNHIDYNIEDLKMSDPSNENKAILDGMSKLWEDKSNNITVLKNKLKKYEVMIKVGRYTDSNYDGLNNRQVNNMLFSIVMVGVSNSIGREFILTPIMYFDVDNIGGEIGTGTGSKNSNHKYHVQVFEYFRKTVPLLEYLDSSKASKWDEKKWLSLLFQVLYYLHSINKRYINFRHNRLNLHSLYIQESNNETIRCDIKDNQYVVDDAGIKVKIGNFYDSTLGKKPNEYYDVHYFFHSIFEYFGSNVSKIPDKILDIVNKVLPERYRYKGEFNGLDEEKYYSNVSEVLSPTVILVKFNFFTDNIINMDSATSSMVDMDTSERLRFINSPTSEMSHVSQNMSADSSSRFFRKNDVSRNHLFSDFSDSPFLDSLKARSDVSSESYIGGGKSNKSEFTKVSTSKGTREDARKGYDGMEASLVGRSSGFRMVGQKKTTRAFDDFGYTEVSDTEEDVVDTEEPSASDSDRFSSKMSPDSSTVSSGHGELRKQWEAMMGRKGSAVVDSEREGHEGPESKGEAGNRNSFAHMFGESSGAPYGNPGNLPTIPPMGMDGHSLGGQPNGMSNGAGNMMGYPVAGSMGYQAQPEFEEMSAQIPSIELQPQMGMAPPMGMQPQMGMPPMGMQPQMGMVPPMGMQPQMGMAPPMGMPPMGMPMGAPMGMPMGMPPMGMMGGSKKKEDKRRKTKKDFFF